MHRNIDLSEALRYLSVLAPLEQYFTFQIVSDRDDGVIAPRILNGKLDDHAEELAEENHFGAGIFVAVNETNLRGRSLVDMVRPRCLWIEADDALPQLPLVPSITSETSPGRHHLIYAVSDLSWEAFDYYMPVLARDYGGDFNAIDRSRVLRLPGFYHRKREPWMVRVIDDLTSGESYRLDHIVDVLALGLKILERRQRPRVQRNGTENEVGQVVTALLQIEAACQAAGGRLVVQGDRVDEVVDWSDRQWWLKVGLCLHHYFSGGEAGFQLWCAASNGDPHLGFVGCPQKFDAGDQRRVWESFASIAQTASMPETWRTIRTIFWLAKQCGSKLAGRRRVPRPRVVCTTAWNLCWRRVGNA